ncbi:MAG: hypothetical protein JO356_15275 [Acidobacteria bacterium]|nr:hypothetical protein [Acidobacteriota bacterium]
MRKNQMVCGFVLAMAVLLPALNPAVLGQDPKLENRGKEAVIMGYVRDAACLMRHPDVLKPANECARMCARAGSPLIIATKTGGLYMPISATIPDKSQTDRLMPFVGKYVRVSGRVFERSGLQAIAITEIEAAPTESE